HDGLVDPRTWLDHDLSAAADAERPHSPERETDVPLGDLVAVFVRLDVQDVSGRPSAEGDFAGGLDPDELGERERGSHAEAVGAIGRQALIRGGEPEGYSEGLVVAR